MEEILNYKIEMKINIYLIRLLGVRFKELACLIFSESGTTDVDNSTQINSPKFLIQMSKFPHFVDILRNEKPLDFEIDSNEKDFSILTLHEPVGESEKWVSR